MKQEVQFDLMGKRFSVITDNPQKLEKTVNVVKKILSESAVEFKPLDFNKFLLYNLLKLAEKLIDTQAELATYKSQLDLLDNDIDSILDT